MAINAFVPDDYVGQIERGRAMFNRNKMAPLERQSQRLANERNAFVNQNMAQDREFGLQDRQRNVALSQFEVMQAINDDMARLPNAEARAHMWNTQGKWAFDNNLISEWKPAGPEAFGDEMFQTAKTPTYGLNLTEAEDRQGNRVFLRTDDQGGVSPVENFSPPQDQLPSYLGKQVDKALTASEDAANQYQRAADLATQFEQVMGEIPSGSPAALQEWYKSFVGGEDEYSLMRNNWASFVNSAVMQDLPPGVASDKDIELARSGYLGKFANAKAVADWLKAYARVQQNVYLWNQFKADWIQSRRTTQGAREAFEKRYKQPNRLVIDVESLPE